MIKWNWDNNGFDGAPTDIDVRRWRRGIVTFYKYTIHLSDNGTFTSYWIYLFNDLGFAIHLPSWILNWFEKRKSK